jgi:hypothetical protein
MPLDLGADRFSRTLGSTAYGSRTAMLWNLAANEQGGPTLPGSDSCGGGCRRKFCSFNFFRCL